MPGREVGAWERERNERGATVEWRFTAVDVPRSWRAYTQQDQSGEVLSQRYLHVGSVPGQPGTEAQLRMFCFCGAMCRCCPSTRVGYQGLTQVFSRRLAGLMSSSSALARPLTSRF